MGQVSFPFLILERAQKASPYNNEVAFQNLSGVVTVDEGRK